MIFLLHPRSLSVRTVRLPRWQFCKIFKSIFLCHCCFIQICRIENVSHLKELTALNLARNRISRVENLQGLDSLTELNLHGNSISVVVSSPFAHSLIIASLFFFIVNFGGFFANI